MVRARAPWCLLSMLGLACGGGSTAVDSGSGSGGVGGETSSSASSTPASSSSGSGSGGDGGGGGVGGSGGGDGGGCACPHLADCEAGCASAMPNPFPPNAACSPEELLKQCVAQCCASTTELDAECAACVAQTIQVDASDDTCGASAGIFLDCAVTACDVIYPCSEPQCSAESHCIRPCPPPMGINWGVCSFVGSGTCSCGAAPKNDCAANAECICPACGEGEGICVTPDQKTSVCFDYMVSPLEAATAHFDCP